MPAIDIEVRYDAWTTLDELDSLVACATEAAIAESGIPVSPETEISFVFADDAFVRELNRTWRRKDKPTNVLSFPTAGAARQSTLGDIIVAYETALGEAGDEAKSLHDHVAHLVVHGVLHLLGFDHLDEAEADAMEAKEARALTRLGIASPYEAVDFHAQT